MDKFDEIEHRFGPRRREFTGSNLPRVYAGRGGDVEVSS